MQWTVDSGNVQRWVGRSIVAIYAQSVTVSGSNDCTYCRLASTNQTVDCR